MRRRLPAKLSEDEFLEIQESIAATPRGRAFLRQFEQRARALSVGELRRLVRSLKEAGRAGGPPSDEVTQLRVLRQELRSMCAHIEQTRREIAALRPADAGNNRIMSATGELDAIVSATERATSDILNAAERIQESLDKIAGKEAVFDEIGRQVTEILTACSFQDITGQRITKVVNALRYLEQRVNAMVEIWGVDGAPSVPSQPEDKRPDAHLLNGPSSNGVSQDDVDAFFA